MSSFEVCSMSKLNMSEKFSEKFVKDLEKLLMWMEENKYVLMDLVTGDIIEWKEELIEFNEPGRNKLESYIKELLKIYLLKKNGEEIDDVKTMIKNFREYKPKKNNKIKKIKNEKVIKNETDIIKNKKPKKVNFNIKDIIVNKDLETNDVHYIDTLDFSTKDLVRILGEPLKNGNEKHQYEWKIEVVSDVDNRVYSIYNWINENGEFKEYEKTEWHLGTNSICLKNNSKGCVCQLKELIKFMNLKLENKIVNTKKKVKESDITKEEQVTEQIMAEQMTKEKDITKDEIEEEQMTKNEMKELFNLSEDDSIIDIDDIHF